MRPTRRPFRLLAALAALAATLLAASPAAAAPGDWWQFGLGVVFVGGIACRPSGDHGGVRAFDGATGQQLWYSHLLGIGNGTEDASNVAATDGAVYFSIYDNAVYGGDNALLSLAARTGAVRWPVAGISGAPAVAGGRLYAATTPVGGEPVTVVDQFALGATAAG